MGLKILLTPNHVMFGAEGRVQKKSPAFGIEDWGFYPLAPFTVLSSKTTS